MHLARSVTQRQAGQRWAGGPRTSGTIAFTLTLTISGHSAVLIQQALIGSVPSMVGAVRSTVGLCLDVASARS